MICERASFSSGGHHTADGRARRADAFARRLRKDVYVADEAGELQPVAEHRFDWDGRMLVYEQSNEHGSTRWIYEPDTHRPLAQVTDAGVWAFATDGLGTPTELVDEQGAVRWTGRMDLMGRVVKGGDASQPLRWPGQYHDDETGLVYNRYRYYSPDDGLFISPDPIGISGGLRLHGYPINPRRAAISACAAPIRMSPATRTADGDGSASTAEAMSPTT